MSYKTVAEEVVVRDNGDGDVFVVKNGCVNGPLTRIWPFLFCATGQDQGLPQILYSDSI